MEELIWEYENMLIGNLSEISIDCFIGIDPGGQNERLAIECFRTYHGLEHGYSNSTI